MTDGLADSEASTAKNAKGASRFGKPVDEEELAFIQAMEDYKVRHDRAFPGWSEALWVLKELGYVKQPS